jgi:hypothetical protein
MSTVLVATGMGCMEFDSAGKSKVNFTGRQVCALAVELEGACLAVVDGKEIWRRSAGAEWTQIKTTSDSLASIATFDGKIFAATVEPALICIPASGDVERLTGFDTIEGRSEWFGQGPPLHVRALTATADGSAIMAAVHVGGIPRSTDAGKTWAPTIPVMHDVHEVRAHPSLPNIVAAATAYGLCVSQDGGRNWTMFAEGLEVTHALSVAVLQAEVLFSVQSDPFAERSQVWRWKIAAEGIEQVLEGLPEWLSGKVDTAQIGAGDGRAAIVDGGGNLWLSNEGSRGWQRIATKVPYPSGILVL